MNRFGKKAAVSNGPKPRRGKRAVMGMEAHKLREHQRLRHEKKQANRAMRAKGV